MIGDLYNAKNVVVGQAALMVAPASTAIPAPSTSVPVMTDPFSIQPWSQAVLSASATITAGSFTLTYTTASGTAYTTASLTATSATAANVASAILTAMAPTGIVASQINVTGGPVSAPATPFNISLDEAYVGGVWSITPTGVTGGTLSITQPIWTPVGATDQGWTWASSKTLQDITIEEQSTLVNRLVASQSVTVTGALSEDIANTLSIVHNMTSVVTASSVSNPGYTTLSMSDNATQYAIVLMMANRLGFPRWLYIPQTTCLANVSTPLRRAAGKRMYSAEFTSVCATAQIQVFEFTSLHQ